MIVIYDIFDLYSFGLKYKLYLSGKKYIYKCDFYFLNMIFSNVLKHFNLDEQLKEKVLSFKNVKINSEKDVFELSLSLENILSSDLYFKLSMINHSDKKFEVNFFNEIFKEINLIGRKIEKFYLTQFPNPIGITKQIIEKRFFYINNLIVASDFRNDSVMEIAHLKENISINSSILRNEMVDIVQIYIQKLIQLMKKFEKNSENRFKIKMVSDLIIFFNNEIKKFKEEILTLDSFSNFIMKIKSKKLEFFDDSIYIKYILNCTQRELYFKILNNYKQIKNMDMSKIYSNYEDHYSRIDTTLAGLAREIKENEL